MCNQHVMSHLVHLMCGVYTTPGRMLATVVAQHCGTPGLVDCDPVLDAVTKAVSGGDGGDVFALVCVSE